MRGSIPSESPWMEALLSRSSLFLVTRGSPFCFLWCKNPTLTLLLRPLFSCLPSFVMRSLLHATWVQVLLLVIASIDWLSKGLLWLQNRQVVPSKDQQRRRGHIRRSAFILPLVRKWKFTLCSPAQVQMIEEERKDATTGKTFGWAMILTQRSAFVAIRVSLRE